MPPQVLTAFELVAILPDWTPSWLPRCGIPPWPFQRTLPCRSSREAGREAEPLKGKNVARTFAPRRRACPTADTAPAQSEACRRDLGPGSEGSLPSRAPLRSHPGADALP